MVALSILFLKLVNSAAAAARPSPVKLSRIFLYSPYYVPRLLHEDGYGRLCEPCAQSVFRALLMALIGRFEGRYLGMMVYCMQEYTFK
jgi:hypothetical protein